jgi:two-component system C4-dicarboxylate transport sensor histidine kinase DctB
MLQSHLRQFGLFACAVGVIGLSAFASQHVWRENGLKSLQAANEPRLQLIANAINAEIGRQDHLPVVLSLDSDVQAALDALGDPGRSVPLIERLNRKLARLSLEANTRAMFVIGPDGTVVASDDWDAPDTLVGRNLADRPYFAQAVADGESSYLGIEPSTNRVRFHLAQAIRDSRAARRRRGPHRVRRP